VTYGNPDLDPQRGNTIDLDLSYQTERLDLVFGVFHRNIKGVIEEVSTGTTDGSGRTIYTFQNVGNGTTTGLSLTQRLSLDHLANPFLAGLTFGANENWATSKLHVYATGATRPFKEQPEFWGDVFVEWTAPSDRFALALAAGYTGEITSAGDNGDERRPSETVLDLKASYQFDNGAELYLLGENLLRTDRVKIKADGTREVEEGPSTLSIGLKATF
jgi:outer membrane receptor protein involved in Fe transport